MLKKLIFILAGIIFSLGTLQSQTGEQANRVKYTLEFATYFSQMDISAFDIHTDSKGYIYISGNTRDRNFPATKGAYQTELKGESDAFVAKFAPDGKIVFATLIGGSKREHHARLTVDNEGYIYLVGGTHSSDFLVTRNAYDTSFNGEKDWGGDAFLVKLNPSGNDIVFSTFIGGIAQEAAFSVAVDSKRNIVIGGFTLSADFPTTDGVIKTKSSGFDSFISKFSPDGNKLLFSTLLGGNDGLSSSIESITTDKNNNIYVAGFTSSFDFPVTENAMRKKSENIKDSGWWDGSDQFLAKINENGTKLLYSTYFGGKSRPNISVTWASPNRLLLSGNTNTKSFPISANAFCKEYKGERDGFISIFNSDEMTLEYSTLFGGNQYDAISDVFFLNEDCIVIGGETNSPDFPITKDAIDSVYPVADSNFSSTFFGKRKFFVSIVDIKKIQLVYSTYLGGGINFRIAPNSLGSLGFLAATESTDFPVTENAFQQPPTISMLGRLVLKDLPKQK